MLLPLAVLGTNISCGFTLLRLCSAQRTSVLSTVGVWCGGLPVAPAWKHHVRAVSADALTVSNLVLSVVQDLAMPLMCWVLLEWVVPYACAPV